MTTTPKTLVPKTATTISAKLLVPAARTGLGRTVAVAYPADVSFPGQLPLPHDSGSEPNPGARSEPLAALLRERMRTATPTAAPAGPTGCLLSGSSARHRPSSLTPPATSMWRRVTAKRPIAAAAK